MSEDIINSPSHYTKWWIEPLEYINSNKMSYMEGNIIKYLTRYRFKNWLEDLKKCEFYIKRLIKEYE